MNNKHKISKQISRKEKEIEQRKKDILIVAEKLFLSQGYDDTTMDQIAQVAEFSKGTVYKYFSSKDEIFLTLGIKSYQMIIDKTKKLTENEEPGVSQLIAVGRAYFEFYKEAPEYAMIFHHIGDKLPLILNKSKEELTPNEKAYLALSDAYRDLFVEIISQAIKYKKIRIDKDPIMIGITLATLTSGLIKELTRRKNNLEKLQLTSDQIVDFVFEMLGEGLKPRE